MKRTFSALALAAGVLAGPALAQDMSMSEALSMLELAAKRELSTYGIDGTEVMALSLSQLATIKTVAESSSYSEDDKKHQIEAILAN